MSNKVAQGKLQAYSYHQRKFHNYRRWFESNSSGLDPEFLKYMEATITGIERKLQSEVARYKRLSNDNKET